MNEWEDLICSSNQSFAKIDMSKLEKGIYFIRILTNENKIVNKKM